ncbi:uncharacterized protein METZ01_LOCUS440094 [marine metagenome]|uniref:Uncharacterized protein n=1 Tax=marine metagenome TaxID=408172 RepID=A0A382YVV0_9ZZZZ
MKKLLIALAFIMGCDQNTNSEDDDLPKIELSEIKVVQEGGGLAPITYSLGFKGNIINTTDNVFKSFRQTVIFNAANGNQIDAEMGLPMFRWLCPRDTLFSGGKSKDFEEGFIDSVISYEPIDLGLIVVYGQGNECDKNN